MKSGPAGVAGTPVMPAVRGWGRAVRSSRLTWERYCLKTEESKQTAADDRGHLYQKRWRPSGLSIECWERKEDTGSDKDGDEEEHVRCG